MASVVNSVTINGAAAPVFDLVTTARFWPQWHPASQAVGGVTQRPFQLGDRIHERGQIASMDFQVTWKVVEHVRPNRIVLECDTPPAGLPTPFKRGVPALSSDGSSSTTPRPSAPRAPRRGRWPS